MIFHMLFFAESYIGRQDNDVFFMVDVLKFQGYGWVLRESFDLT